MWPIRQPQKTAHIHEFLGFWNVLLQEEGQDAGIYLKCMLRNRDKGRMIKRDLCILNSLEVTSCRYIYSDVSVDKQLQQKQECA